MSKLLKSSLLTGLFIVLFGLSGENCSAQYYRHNYNFGGGIKWDKLEGRIYHAIGYQYAGDNMLGYEISFRPWDKFGFYMGAGYLGIAGGLKYYLDEGESSHNITLGMRSGIFRPLSNDFKYDEESDMPKGLQREFRIGVAASGNFRLFNFSRRGKAGVELKLGAGYLLEGELPKDEFPVNGVYEYSEPMFYVFTGLAIAF